jgi:hypothetical protein
VGDIPAPPTARSHLRGRKIGRDRPQRFQTSGRNWIVLQIGSKLLEAGILHAGRVGDPSAVLDDKDIDHRTARGKRRHRRLFVAMPEGTFASLARTRQSKEGTTSEGLTSAALVKEATEDALENSHSRATSPSV